MMSDNDPRRLVYLDALLAKQLDWFRRRVSTLDPLTHKPYGNAPVFIADDTTEQSVAQMLVERGRLTALRDEERRGYRFKLTEHGLGTKVDHVP